MRIGYSIPRVLMVDDRILLMWALNVNPLSRVTPRYLAWLDQGIVWFHKVIFGNFDFDILLNRIATVLFELTAKRQFLNHRSAAFI